MLATLIAAAAVILIVRDMLRPSARTPTPLWRRVARGVPFAVVAALSLLVASNAPQGRKAFQIDLTLSIDDLSRSMTKVPHLRSIAILFLLAVVAFGAHRLIVAFAATMLVGVGWELAQTTIVGHNARLADLAPNFVSGLVCLVAIAGLRWVLVQRNAAFSPSETAEAPQ